MQFEIRRDASDLNVAYSSLFLTKSAEFFRKQELKSPDLV